MLGSNGEKKTLTKGDTPTPRKLQISEKIIFKKLLNERITSRRLNGAYVNVRKYL